jgi:hypothetical protein
MITLALLLALSPQELKAAGAPGMAAIHGDALSAHVRFLADDLLEGRGTGTRGHAIAARYLATQLQSMGYSPAGDGGTYFQKVPFVGMTIQPEQSSLELDGTPLKYGDEVLYGPRAGSASDDVSGELVFAGYGVSAPAYKYDDIPDVRGKIAVILYGAPRSDRADFFPTAASAVYSDSVRKSRLLAERGAIGILQIFTPEMAKHLPFPFFTRQAGFEMMVWIDGDKPGAGSALPYARLPYTMLQRLLAKSGKSADEIFAAGPPGKLKPFSLGVKARLRVSAAVRRFESENVVAILKGGERANEFVAISAHLDHLGVGVPIKGDTVYNGAVDNASGCSGALEVARAFTALPRRPPRSILMVFVTGEEKGLQGSEYFTNHPTVPISSIVANVNLDGVYEPFEPFDVVALGAEHSTLEKSVQAMGQVLGLGESPDPQPEQVFFIRSDQYNFVKRGIPAVFIAGGWRDESGKVDPKRKEYDEWWTTNRYHQPSDEWDPKLNYEFMAKEARAHFLVALDVALDPARPQWNRGDVFGALFK